MTASANDVLLVEILATRTPVGTADEALGVLSAIVDALPETDGIRCFSRLYQAVTAEVRSAIGAATFRDPSWLDRLDAVFANLYFHALSEFLRASPDTPRAWYPLFETRASGRAPLQFAFAGMNAHINRDLPLALVTVARQTGSDLSRSSPHYQVYVAVNPLLAAVEDRVKKEFLLGPLAVADELLGKVDDVIANFSIAEARAGAWAHGEALFALRETSTLGSTFLDTLDGLVGFASRGLLISL
jgi:hypothetical protein